MNRRNKIIIGILALFLVMAVGYAIFTATLKINGTASAQGNLDLTYECVSKDEHGGTGTCKVEEDKSITTTSTLSKPTDRVGYRIKVTNTGTIPVVLKEVISPNNVSEESPDVAGDAVYFDKTTFLGAFYVTGKMSSGGIIEEEFMGDQAVKDANITIQPSESILVDISHNWIDADNIAPEQPVLPEDGAIMIYNLTFKFQQVTE